MEPYTPHDLYRTLGCEVDATLDDVRRAYRRLAVQLHPDKSAQDTKAQFAAVTEAYEILSDPRRREVYDAFGLDVLHLYEEAHRFARTVGAVEPTSSPPPVDFATGLVAGGALLVVLLGLALVLAALHYDGYLDAVPWWLLFLPLWLALPLATAMAAVIGAGADTPAAAREAVRELAPTAALQLSFLVLLCYRLHQTSPDAERDRYTRPDAMPLAWLHVFAPLFVQRGVALSGLPEALRERQLLAATCRPAARPTHLDSPSGGWARDAAWLLLSTTQLTVLPPLLSTTLLGDGGLHVSWRLALLPMHAWLLLELALTASIYCDGADRSLPANAHPADKLRAWWRQSRRGLWLVTLTALLLLFTWGGGALEAIRSGRRLAMELIGPLLVILALALSCVGCLCGTLRRQRPRSRKSAGGGGGGGRATPTAAPMSVSTPRARLHAQSGAPGTALTPEQAAVEEMALALKAPPSAEEALMAAELWDATFSPHYGQLPGAMPPRSEGAHEDAVKDAVKDAAAAAAAATDWTTAFEDLEEGAPPTRPHTSQAHDSRAGAQYGAQPKNWMQAFDDDDEQSRDSGGGALEDPPSDWDEDEEQPVGTKWGSTRKT
jgi:hypothetical protein